MLRRWLQNSRQNWSETLAARTTAAACGVVALPAAPAQTAPGGV